MKRVTFSRFAPSARFSQEVTNTAPLSFPPVIDSGGLAEEVATIISMVSNRGGTTHRREWIEYIVTTGYADNSHGSRFAIKLEVRE